MIMPWLRLLCLLLATSSLACGLLLDLEQPEPRNGPDAGSERDATTETDDAGASVTRSRGG